MGLFNLFKKKPIVNIETSTHEYPREELENQQEDKVDEIKKLCQSSLPSSNGLLPHEIMMLSYAPKYYLGETTFPRFWYYEYGIDNPNSVLSSLVNRGFIAVSSAKESVAFLKVAELKGLLSDAGIKAIGKKTDLVKLVKDYISEEVLNSKIVKRPYKLTNLGEEELIENEYVLYFGKSKKYGLTVWDMNKMLENYPKKLFRDKIWGHLNLKIQKAAEELHKSGNMFLYYKDCSNIKYEMCNFLIEENRHLQTALDCIAEALYYDIKVITVVSYKTYLEYQKGEKTPNNFLDYSGLDYKSRPIKILKDRLKYSSEELKTALSNCFAKLSIEYNMIKIRNITNLEISDYELAALFVYLTDGNIVSAQEISRNVEYQIKRDTLPVHKEDKLYSKIDPTQREFAERDPEYRKLLEKLARQDQQHSDILAAEEKYKKDVDALISFWESIWESGGLLFNGSKWTFRLPDLYISEKRYDDALRILKRIKNPPYQDKKKFYIDRISKLKEKKKLQR